MTEEQIERKKQYIREQLENKSGIYATLFIRTFYYIASCCRENKTNWCYGYNATDSAIAKYAYATVRGGRVDHMGSGIVKKIKQELTQMGYLAFKEIDNTWRIYVLNELDFLAKPIEDYIEGNKVINLGKDKKLSEIYQYLSKNGVDVYAYTRQCWCCGRDTTIYSYYLDVQIKNALGASYVKKIDYFSNLGLGYIDKLDNEIMNRVKTVTKAYSKTMERAYVLNTCSHCGAIQGINFTVFRPEELMKLSKEQLIAKREFTIALNECNLTKEDIATYFGND